MKDAKVVTCHRHYSASSFPPRLFLLLMYHLLALSPTRAFWPLFLPILGSLILVPSSSSLSCCTVVTEANLAFLLSDALVPVSKSHSLPEAHSDGSQFLTSFLLPARFLQLHCPCSLCYPLRLGHFQPLPLERGFRVPVSLMKGHLLWVVHLEPESLSHLVH